MAVVSKDPNWALRNAVTGLAFGKRDRIGVVRPRQPRRPGGRPIAGRVRRGNCYVACEVLYHVLGGKAAGLTPMVAACPWDPDERHWFLRQDLPSVHKGWRSTRIIDPSSGQFTKAQKKLLPQIYAEGRGTGFLTSRPSLRARKLIAQLTWQEPRRLARGRVT